MNDTTFTTVKVTLYGHRRSFSLNYSAYRYNSYFLNALIQLKHHVLVDELFIQIMTNFVYSVFFITIIIILILASYSNLYLLYFLIIEKM